MNGAEHTNSAELLVDGHRILPALLEDIARARRSVHVSIFLFFRDPIGERVADALIAARGRGVVIRVLLNVEKTEMGDPFSTGEKEMMKHDPNVEHDPLDIGPLCERMRDGGIAVHDTNIDYDRVIDHADPRLRSIGAQIKDTIDIDDLHVDHRKLIVVDGAIAWCGGANIGAQYMFMTAFDPAKDAKIEGEEWKNEGNPEPWWKWHDSLTRFEGPIARALEDKFRERWILDGGEPFELEPSPTTFTHDRGHRIKSASVYENAPDGTPNAIRELYVERITNAERSIFIENPYTYHPAIIDALVRAKKARPELRVDLIVPAREWNDNELAHDAQQYHYAELIEHGAHVYEYQNHFNHLKMAVFDERWSIHGSTNMNFRSLEDDKDFELVVLVDDEPMAKRILAAVRDVDIPFAKRFTEADLSGLHGALRVRTRDPRTLLLVSRRVL